MGVNDHHPIHLVSPQVGLNRDARADQPTGLRLLHGRQLLFAVENLQHQLADRQIQHALRHVGAEGFGEGLHPGREDLDAGDVMLHASSRHGRDEQVPLLGNQHIFAENLVANGPRTIHRQVNVTRVVQPRHFVRVLQDLIDLVVEPHVQGFIDQAAGEYREQQGRD